MAFDSSTASIGQVSLQAATDDRKSFVTFVKNAAENNSSSEYKELRSFLIQCFVDADTDFDGLISLDDFDKLVERAGALPRKWGFAPTTSEMFANDAAKKAFRKKTFDQVASSGLQTFAVDEWLTWSFKHIREKAAFLNRALAQSKISTSKEDFVSFVVAAAKSRHCPEYKELYYFLEDCFNSADDDHNGVISAEEFDKVVEAAGAAPRKFGLAPPTNVLYRTPQERLKARTWMFQQITAKNERGMKDTIALNSWISWAYAHICAKAKDLDPSLSGVPPPIGDLSNASYGGAATRVRGGGHRGISVELAQADKEMFVQFIRNASESQKTPEYQELFHFLKDCFVACDTDFDGLIRKEDFSHLVELAGALPRKWGFAPTTREMFSSQEALNEFRMKTFREINKSGTGAIYYDEWMNWCYAHVCMKTQSLKKEDGSSKMNTNKEDFRQWVINAAKSRKSPEYKELYSFLLDCFRRADSEQTGLLTAKEFDKVVELAGAAPRKFGFAPPTNQTYRNDEDRIRSRNQMFQEIVSKNRRGFRDRIPFNSWMEWSYAHICAKAKILDPSLSGRPEGTTESTPTYTGASASSASSNAVTCFGNEMPCTIS